MTNPLSSLARIEELIEPAIAALGYRLVLVRFHDSGKQHALQVMAERQDESSISLEDCTLISRTLSALLDVEDPITGAYTLEISSPGIDRPLVRPEDFMRYAGQEAKIETKLMIDGRKRFKGTLAGMENGAVRLEMEEGMAAIPFENIQFAKLVLTDALMRQHLNAAKKQHKKDK